MCSRNSCHFAIIINDSERNKKQNHYDGTKFQLSLAERREIRWLFDMSIPLIDFLRTTVYKARYIMSITNKSQLGLCHQKGFIQEKGRIEPGACRCAWTKMEEERFGGEEGVEERDCYNQSPKLETQFFLCNSPNIIIEGVRAPPTGLRQFSRLRSLS